MTNNLTISKSIPLVSQMEAGDVLKIQLTYDENDIDLELGVTYNMNSSASCYAGYYLDTCGGL